LKEPFLIGGKPIYISASIGVVIADSSYATATEIIRDADLAMYEAKTQGKGRYVTFLPTLRLDALNRMALDTDLRGALKNNEFVLHFQPIFSLESMQVTALEALIRWQHPSRGLMPPSTFIPIAESNTFIDSITRWTIQEACRQLGHWRAELPSTASLSVSVNLSPISLRQPELLRWVEESLTAASLTPDSLTLEIVENAFIQDPDLAGRTFNDLRQLGVGVSLDDFGIGYSSFSYINQYPIDVIKVDRSFVGRVTKVNEIDAIVRAITALARDLNYKIIAEGIETKEQLDFMKQIGCHYGQGFLVSEPMDPQAVCAFLRDNAGSNAIHEKIGAGNTPHK
jgi:EAL domain-containing protein (putative c-di-GMP-specific phosphodiesterase class I)